MNLLDHRHKSTANLLTRKPSPRKSTSHSNIEEEIKEEEESNGNLLTNPKSPQRKENELSRSLIKGVIESPK